MKDNIVDYIRQLPGPCVIFGAGGFIGFNLFWRILEVRKDVFGVFSDPKKNWRLKMKSPPLFNVVKCNILERGEVKRLFSRIKPRTVINLSSYGAYSSQDAIDRIYQTNFNATYGLIEELKKYDLRVYIHAGTQSEYGLNSYRPSEQSELIPNSHYAVSKVADYYLLKYYGKLEKLPVAHLRLYSVYGSWEEPTRLIPTLLLKARNGKLPPFVDPTISRDFIYIDDVLEAIILVASKLARNHPKLYGEVFNICTGKKTTMRELAVLTRKLFAIKAQPQFGTMKNRNWDLKDWYGNPNKTRKVFGWKAKIGLASGLQLTSEYGKKP